MLVERLGPAGVRGDKAREDRLRARVLARVHRARRGLDLGVPRLAALAQPALPERLRRLLGDGRLGGE